MNIRSLNGSGLIEILIGGAMAFIVGLGLIQMLLLYQAHLQVHQATMAAARVGAVNHARLNHIRQGFIENSLDLHGGGHNAPELLAAYRRAQWAVNTPPELGGAGFQLEILNPTPEAFDDFAETINGERFIPNHWQHIKATTPGQTSGVSIQDANILKIHITYGAPLVIPVIDRLVAQALTWMNPANIRYYQNTPVRIPLHATAVIHMQTAPVENQR